MRKLLTICILTIAVSFGAVGCSHVLPLVEKYVPEISAKAEGMGLDLKFNPSATVEVFCVKEGGKIDSIPVVGGVLAAIIGTCPVE
jgi:hypothetical protein